MESVDKNVLRRDDVPLSEEKSLSYTIDVLRFPLALMVIFIHMVPATVSLQEADFPALSGQGLLNIVYIAFSRVVPYVAVPTFFLISGFLFFINFREWSWDGYKKKMKSRLRSLVIPYFLWNTAVLAFIIIGKILSKHASVGDIWNIILEKGGWHIYYDSHSWGQNLQNWLGDNLYYAGPIDIPLWFLRDLIFVSACAPLIYWFVKKARIFGIALLFLAYVSKVWISVPGFTIAAVFFFSLGAYLAVNGLNIVTIVKKSKYVHLPLTLILLCLAVYYNGDKTVIGNNIFPFFVCAGVLTAFYIASLLVEKYGVRPKKILVSSCFFIYAFHSAPFCPGCVHTMGIAKKVFHTIIPGQSLAEEWIVYLASPFLAAAICILVLMILRKISPKLALLFSGNK